MPSYIAIADTEVDPESPLTTSIATRWRDNPLAMFEGASGAPKLQQEALDVDTGYWVPIAEVEITSSSAQADLLTPFDNAQYGAYKIVGSGIVCASASTLNVQFSRDGSSIVTTDVVAGLGQQINNTTWAAYTTYGVAGAAQGAAGVPIVTGVADDSNSVATNFEMFISNEITRNTGLTYRHDFPMFSFWGSTPQAASSRFQEFVGMFKGTGAGGQLVDGVRFKASTGNITQGKFVLYGMRYVP